MSNLSVLGDLNGIFKMNEKISTKDKWVKLGPCVGMSLYCSGSGKGSNQCYSEMVQELL